MTRRRYSNGDYYYAIVLALSQGWHEYKFVVDGVWCTEPNSPTIRNNMGTLNNIIEVGDPSGRSSPRRPMSESKRRE